MKENTLKILIPLFAIVVIVESLMLVSKLVNKPTLTQPETVSEEVETVYPLSLNWDSVLNEVKTGVTTNLPLTLVSTKDEAIDAIDLYVNYDPNIVEVKDVVVGKGLPQPSFKKINAEKGMVVLNFLISDVGGFQLKAGQVAGLVDLKVNFVKEGIAEFTLGEASLVVENTSAKVLPFNNENLVINVTQ